MAKRTLEGKVVSDKMQKTRILEIEERFVHKQYKKIVRHTKRFKFHDEQNQTRTGDIVQVIESRPLSREKHWRLVSVLQKAGAEVVQRKDEV